MNTRAFVLALAVLALAACGRPASNGQAAPPANGTVTLGATQNLPDWLLVARQRDDCPSDALPSECTLGDITFNQRTITRHGDGTADIWVQVRHGRRQPYQISSDTSTTTIHYTVERLHYRFKCAEAQFFVVERQILGAGETVIAHDEPPQIYRAPVSGSVTGVIMPIACRGV